MHACVQVAQHTCGSQKITYKSWSFLPPSEAQGSNQVIRLDSKYLYLLSHPTHPFKSSFKNRVSSQSLIQKSQKKKKKAERE